MLLQALLSIAFITVLAGALLTSALVDVKVASHETATRQTTAALARGTDEFVNWAQRYVSKYGASASWPTSTITDEPTPACASNAQDAGSACNSFVTVAYAITGSSEASARGPDLAQNLQQALNENRISGTITATMTSLTGEVESTRTREATVRVFNAPPFAILTGTRDVTAIAASINASQGDSGGYNNALEGLPNATPDPTHPSLVTKTSISVTMTCSNSVANGSNSRPFSDNNSPGNDYKPWGNGGSGGFETPCAPVYAFTTTPAIPPDAVVGNSNVYTVDRFEGSQWNDNARRPNAWPK